MYLADYHIHSSVSHDGRLSMADNLVQPSVPYVIRQGAREDAPIHHFDANPDSSIYGNPQ